MFIIFCTQLDYKLPEGRELCLFYSPAYLIYLDKAFIMSSVNNYLLT